MRKKVVLLIDDKLEIREILKKSLQDNFNVIDVRSVREAVDILNNPRKFPCIDIIATDDEMSSIRGVYLIRNLGASQLHRHIPTILYTQKKYGICIMTLKNGCKGWMYPEFKNIDKKNISIVADKINELASAE